MFDIISNSTVDGAGVWIMWSRTTSLPREVATLTRFCSPLSNFVNLDTLVLMTRVRRLRHGSVWAYRWKAAEARPFVDRIVREILAATDELDALDVRCDVHLAPGYLWLEWPHFDCYEYVSGFDWRLKHDVARMRACLQPLVEAVIREG